MTNSPNTTPGTLDPAERGSGHEPGDAVEREPLNTIGRLRKAIIAAQSIIVADHAHFFTVVDSMDAALAAVEREMAEMRSELDAEIDLNLRLEDKLDETKHGCACEYDERGEVCMVHHKPVREARERIAALEAERAELRKDAERWREFRAQCGLSVSEEGEVGLFAVVAESTEVEDAPWLTEIERRALDGELGTEPLDGIRNGWIWKADALDRAVDSLFTDAEKTKVTEVKHA